MADSLPTTKRFQLFGFGHRRKLFYQTGSLRDAYNGEVVAQCQVLHERFDPGEYRVVLDTSSGPVVIQEDEEGLGLDQRGDRQPLTRSPVRLPSFAGHPQAALLRALHAELLVHVMPWGPVPNLWVYPRPWYRDAAMMALAFLRTGNDGLLTPWIDGLHLPHDHNNRGMAEPDNLGQVLFLASLTSGRKHSIVEKALAAAQLCRKDGHLVGLTDYAEHPVYQTKWMKFGLRALGMDDSAWRIPRVPDSYSSLFWMDFRDEHVPHDTFGPKTLHAYPYLNWAEAHFMGASPPEAVTADTFPLSREVLSSEADYARMNIVSKTMADAQWASPHTWHAAEMFLYHLDRPAGK